MAWGYYELCIPPDEVPRIGIATYLRRAGCGCTPLRLSCSSYHDRDSLSEEYTCLSCDRTLRISTQQSSFTASKKEEHS